MWGINPSRLPEPSFSHLPTVHLVTPRRWDLAVKWRFFRHLLSNTDADAERVYRWHIEARRSANAKVHLGMDGKSGTDQYVQDCGRLVISMGAHGFKSECAIPIDPNGELLGGAHRVACALALGIEAVPVSRQARVAWAPAWDEAWFIAADTRAVDLAHIRKDWRAISG